MRPAGPILVSAFLALAAQLSAASHRSDAKPRPDLGYARAEVLVWTDAQGLDRELWVAGEGLSRCAGFLARMDYDSPKVSVLGSSEHLGGVTEVMHLAASENGAKAVAGSRDGLDPKLSLPFAGEHHLVHRLEYRFKARPKPSLPEDEVLVSRALTAFDGKDELLYSLTFDFSRNPEGQALYDSRSPYNEWDWPLNGYGSYTGFESGYRGILRSDAVKGGKGLATRRDDCNRVPFTRQWDSRSGREIGMVATREWADQPQGQEAWAGSPTPILKPGARSLKEIPPWELPNQVGAYYDWRPKLAWQTYHHLGKALAGGLGRGWEAWPRYSYAVWLCLGRSKQGRVKELVAEMEQLRLSGLSASRGSVPAEAPRGAADARRSALPSPGWDPARGAWIARADKDGVFAGDWHLAGPFRGPTLIVEGLKPGAKLRIDGKEAAAFISFDAARKEAWVTLKGVWQGDLALALD